jgi:hypothetical protein
MEFERQSKHDRQEGERAIQFSAGGMKIGSAVGKQPALNSLRDQIAVIMLLARIPPADGGPTEPLYDPRTPGQADAALINAILRFQRAMAAKGLMPAANCDGRVDAGGTTLALLNRFAGAGPSPKPVTPVGPKANGRLAWLLTLASKLAAPPINWKLTDTSNIGLSIGPVGGTMGKMELTPNNPSGPAEKLVFAGFGFQIGLSEWPEIGAELPGPAQIPSYSSQLFKGPRTTTTNLTLDELLGPCVMLSITAAVNYGISGSVILFNTGSNRSLKYLPGDILSSLEGAQSFVMDSFASCKAFACSAGALGGLSLGFGVTGVKLVRENWRPSFRP